MAAEIRTLRDALERTDEALRAVLGGRPVRDADEVLAGNAFLLFADPTGATDDVTQLPHTWMDDPTGADGKRCAYCAAFVSNATLAGARYGWRSERCPNGWRNAPAVSADLAGFASPLPGVVDGEGA